MTKFAIQQNGLDTDVEYIEADYFRTNNHGVGFYLDSGSSYTSDKCVAFYSHPCSVANKEYIRYDDEEEDKCDCCCAHTCSCKGH